MGTSFEMRGVQRLFRDFQLGPLDLDLEEGRVLGLVGPNGAGKTTTIHMLAGLVRPSAGEISLLGQPMKLNDAGWKRDIGFVSDQPAYYERWSIAKNIRFVSKFYPEWDDDYAANLLKRLQLDPDKRAKDLSRGNRVKLSLLMALSHRPRLCLFDEPTSGLDPLVRLEVLDLLHELMEHGEHAILYSTHILSDLERIADEVAFLLDGQLAVRSRIDELADRWRKLSFVHDGEVQLAAGTLHQRSGRQHLVITSDYDATKQALDGQGVKVQQESTLSIEEIAVHILQGESMRLLLATEINYHRDGVVVGMMLALVVALAMLGCLTFFPGIEPARFFFFGGLILLLMNAVTLLNILNDQLAERRWEQLLVRPVSLLTASTARIVIILLFSLNSLAGMLLLWWFLGGFRDTVPITALFNAWLLVPMVTILSLLFRRLGRFDWIAYAVLILLMTVFGRPMSQILFRGASGQWFFGLIGSPSITVVLALATLAFAALEIVLFSNQRSFIQLQNSVN